MPQNLAQQFIEANTDPATPSLPMTETVAKREEPPLQVDIFGVNTEEERSLPSVVVTADSEPPLQVDVAGGQTIVRDAPQDQTYLTNTGPDNQNFGFRRKELPEVVVTTDREVDTETKTLPKVVVTADREVEEEKELPPTETVAKREEDLPAPERQAPVAKFPKSVNDWRVKLSLAPQSQQSNYLYNQADPGILAPLKGTDGVIFPYTPQINIGYAASYDQTDLTHSNYRIYQYRGSHVGEISIQADFTAQDTVEANYLLAVIHFFKSATKMFYGRDTDPKPGTPPPLCYLSGYGLYQFNNCPLVISNFSYSLPSDVDYIRAGSATMVTGENFRMDPTNIASAKKTSNSLWSKLVRMSNSGVTSGAMKAPPSFNTSPSATENTYVPTKMSISLTCLPIVTRKDVSDSFSLSEYSKGKLWGMW